MSGVAAADADADLDDIAATSDNDCDPEEGHDDPDVAAVGAEYPNCYFPDLLPAIDDPRFDVLFSNLPASIVRPPGVFHNVLMRS